MSEGVEVPIRYAVSIGFHDDNYWAVIYLPEQDEYATCINPNLTKLMNLVSSRIRKKEKQIANFPLPGEREEPSLILPEDRNIILPNGSV